VLVDMSRARRRRGRCISLNVLIITHYYDPEIGAPQRRFNGFVPRWIDAGLSVTVVTSLPHYPDGKFIGETRLGYESGRFGERIFRVPFVPRATEGMMKFLDHAVVGLCASGFVLSSRDKPDVILATVPTLPAMAVGRLAAARYGVPLVIEMRDAWPDLLEESGRRGALARRVSRACTSAQRKASAVVTVAKSFGIQLATRGVRPDRIVHIPNGINSDTVPLLPAREADRRLRVLYLGTHGVSQGLETVVDAVARLATDEVSVRFIGGGTERRALQERARTRGVSISFEQAVSGQALWDAYSWADTCIVSLRDWRPFRYTVPSKLYEIAACGRHITAAVAGEAAETVESLGAGTVVRPGDPRQLAECLRRLRLNPRELEVGSRPRERVIERYDYRVLASTYQGVFERLAG
jgi:colanic acid biosynthesis glycosyl transferase WcaI